MKSLGKNILGSGGVSIVMGGIDFKSFVTELDNANKENHKAASVSYFLAGLTAIASLTMSFFDY